MANRLLSIDPSTKALGWAAFVHTDELSTTSLINNRRAKLVKSGCEYVKDGGDEEQKYEWVHRIDEMVMLMRSRSVSAFEGLGDGWDASFTVLIELPDVFGSGRGEAAANTGAILKLMGCVFALRQAFLDDGDGEIGVQLIPVRRWKGTVPKHITQQRIRNAWGWQGADHNEADAVGIGDWWLRKVRGYQRTV